MRVWPDLLAKETEARKEAKKKASTVKKVKPAQVETIPKPKGSPGDGYNLQREMGLEDQAQKYNVILVWTVVFPSALDVTDRSVTEFRARFDPYCSTGPLEVL
jgi:hypothetical protein